VLAREVTQAFTDLAHAHWLGIDWASDAEDTCRALGTEAVHWLVVDHYALDRRWEQALRPHCRRLMAIDDLADRPHDCDLLLDQNLGRTAADYSDLLPANTSTLIGPQYALLRPEFAQLRAESLARRTNPQLKRLLITMGGVDKDNSTGRVLDALNTCTLPPDLRISVVMGPYAPWLQHVQTQATQMHCPIQVLVGVSDMARLMADSDLAIGAAGGTSWERCCLGLPTIQLVLAENQNEAAAALTASGAVVSVSCVSDLLFKLPELMQQIQSRELLAKLSEHASKIGEGRGTSIITDWFSNQSRLNEADKLIH
jgi:UDP-2,4-diacetamido-2,4,6-trideoxy-beta-L-altropyranose hydrolase